MLGRTQAEVKEKLKTAIAESQGIEVRKSDDEYTVAAWLRTWYELYARPNVRTATVHSVHLMLHCALDRAVKERLIPWNPCED